MRGLTKTIAFPVKPVLAYGDPRLLLGAALLIIGLLIDRVLARR